MPPNKDELIQTIACSLDCNDLASARAVCDELLELEYHNFLGHFFSAEIHERQGHVQAALDAYALAQAIFPEQDKPFQRFVRLAQKSGKQNEFVSDAQISIVNGGPFHAYGFNGNTVYERGMGGTESAIVLVARELARLGKKVDVFCACDKPGIYDGVTYRSNRYYEIFQRLSSPKVVLACRNDHYFHAKTRATKKIIWIHDVANNFYNHLKNYQLDRFDSIFCLSTYQKNNWLENYSMPAQLYFQTTNGFDEKVFFLPKNQPRELSLMYVSRPSRGLQAAFEVFFKLLKTHPDLKFKVCAYTHQKSLADDDEWQPFLTYLRHPSVVNLGELSKTQLADHLRASLLLIYPNTSLGETSCIAAIEAMACGTPVITSDRGALPETVPDGVGGVIVPYGTTSFIADMAQAVASLITNRDSWQRLSQNAANYAMHKYPWSHVVSSWLKLF